MQNKPLDDLILVAAIKTPEISFCARDGLMCIKGKSIPENATNFYKPVLEWVEHYIKYPANKTEIRFEMDYFNTSSSLGLLEILKRFNKLRTALPEYVLKVIWYYDCNDPDMRLTGEDFSELLKLPIELVEI